LRASIRRRSSNERFEALTEDMNCDGICFRSAVSLALGEYLEIQLDLDGLLGPSHCDFGLKCFGRVVQAESDAPAAPFRYGCEILDYALEPAGRVEERQVQAEVREVTVL